MWFGFERESLMEWFKFMPAREIEDGRFELAGGEREIDYNVVCRNDRL